MFKSKKEIYESVMSSISQKYKQTLNEISAEMYYKSADKQRELLSKGNLSDEEYKKGIERYCKFKNAGDREVLKHGLGNFDLLHPKTREQLRYVINNEIEEKGYDCDLNHIDVSEITDMSYLFSDAYSGGRIGFDTNVVEFEGSISKWDVSNVKSMKGMFEGNRYFSGNISKWDVSNVEDMSSMFEKSVFKEDISRWNVSNVKDMSCMFYCSEFGKRGNDISLWDVSNVEDMSQMFYGTYFNSDISRWNVSNVKSMRSMFEKSIFKGDISKWNISKKCDTTNMFGK